MKILSTDWEASDGGELEHARFPDVASIIETPADPAGALPATLRNAA